MIPSFVKPVLWSYDTSKIDLKKDKKTLIFQVLNFGSEKAVSWLFRVYGKDDIAYVTSTIPKTAWNKKSLVLWSLVLGINPPAKRLLE